MQNLDTLVTQDFVPALMQQEIYGFIAKSNKLSYISARARTCFVSQSLGRWFGSSKVKGKC
jgi:hypothetical protein